MHSLNYLLFTEEQMQSGVEEDLGAGGAAGNIIYNTTQQRHPHSKLFQRKNVSYILNRFWMNIKMKSCILETIETKPGARVLTFGNADFKSGLHKLTPEIEAKNYLQLNINLSRILLIFMNLNIQNIYCFLYYTIRFALHRNLHP